MKNILKLVLLLLIVTLTLEAKVQRVKDNYVVVKTAGTTYVGNSLDQTYSINPNTINSGDTIVIIDQSGNNTIELVGGLTITSSQVVHDEMVLTLSNGAVVDIRGADTFTFDVGANQDSSVTGTKENFSTFVQNRLGLTEAPSVGQSVVDGGVDEIVEGGESTNNENENENVSNDSNDDTKSDSNDENDNEDDDENNGDNDNGTSTTQNDGTNPVSNSSQYTLLAWNDLGMHCFDGSDFSVFSILPPYNNLNAHLIKKDGTSNKHVTSGVSITYESLAYAGKINTKSSNKTNFWDFAAYLFPGYTSVKEVGLTGNKTPSTIPYAMRYNSQHSWWEADGIPILNRDDDNTKNYYPMVRVVAKNTAGAILATADVVLPVSDEMDCAKCHASTVSSNDAKPIAGWENNTDVLKDYKLNILKLHDEKYPINSTDLSALSAKGYNYQTSLSDTAKSGTPILCAACHSSTVLGTTNIGNAKALTTALHSKHASVIDPSNGLTLRSSSNRTSCYSCHPGAETECLRGAMGSAKDASGNQTMQCQSCHGTMDDIGNTNRTGWLDEPNCQVCHQDGQRHESALVNGSLRSVLDNKFATNPNTPSAGVSLYRYSTGHGDLQCSSCHGSTHAVFPTSHVQDNIYSEQIQGHSGTIAECTSCHTTMPNTTTGGPHGMHTVGQNWVNDHEHIAERNSAQCTTCHGSDYRGSVLSKTFTNRTLNAEHTTKTYAKGEVVGCYDCHNKKW